MEDPDRPGDHACPHTLVTSIPDGIHKHKHTHNVNRWIEVKAHEVFNDVPQTVLKRPKQLPLPQERPEPTWETVTPVMPQSRFQEAPLAPHPPLARGLGI